MLNAVTAVTQRISRKSSKHSPAAWSALENIIRLAAAANIPICGGAFSVTNEIINIVNQAGDNQSTCKGLIEKMASHTETIWHFVEAMRPEDLRDSTERDADMARNAIRTFRGVLEDVFAILQRLSKQNALQRMLSQKATKDEIAGCTSRLVAAHESFQNSRSSVATAIVRDTRAIALDIKASLSNSSEPKDLFNIAGARPLRPHELPKLKSRVKISDHPFWESVYEGQMGDSERLVKVYDRKSGGKEASLRDLGVMGDIISCNVLQVWGHCHEARTPFIVLTVGRVTPFMDYLCKVTATLPEKEAFLDVWQNLKAMQAAEQFLKDTDDTIIVQKAFMSAFVDEHTGQVMLAPLDKHPDDVSYRCSAGDFNDATSYWVFAFLTASFPPSFRALVRCEIKLDLPACLQDASWTTTFLHSSVIPRDEMWWPWDVTCSSTSIGSLGVFVRTGNRGAIFRKLGDLRFALGRVTCEGISDWEELSPGAFRWHYSPPEDGREPEASDGADEDDSTNRFCVAVNHETAREYLSRHGRRLAQEYQVSSRELVLVTSRNFILSVKSPWTLFVHVDLDVIGDAEPYAYCTLDGIPLSRNEADVRRQDMMHLGVVEVDCSYPNNYIQLWRENDFEDE